MQHYARMGAAIWLYGWLVLRQTHERDHVGWVLGGAPITYREIEEETGFNCRTLERWMRDLRRCGYIETEAVPAGIVVRITKAKKFPQFAQAVRKSEGGVRAPADTRTQSCVADEVETLPDHAVTGRIGSSSIAGVIEKQIKSEIHKDFHNPNLNQQPTQKPTPSRLEQNRNTKPDLKREEEEQIHRRFFAEARWRRELLRAERDEEVRRELAVGTGPEMRRS